MANEDAADLGDFVEIVDENAKPQQKTTIEAPTRVRLPRGSQVVGKVHQRLGGNRMDILCNDNKTRNCRVPGRFKRSMWLRVNDIVLIEPWEHDPEKGDVVYKYNSGEIIQLKKRGLITTLNQF